MATPGLVEQFITGRPIRGAFDRLKDHAGPHATAQHFARRGFEGGLIFGYRANLLRFDPERELAFLDPCPEIEQGELDRGLIGAVIAGPGADEDLLNPLLPARAAPARSRSTMAPANSPRRRKSIPPKWRAVPAIQPVFVNDPAECPDQPLADEMVVPKWTLAGKMRLQRWNRSSLNNVMCDRASAIRLSQASGRRLGPRR